MAWVRLYRGLAGWPLPLLHTLGTLIGWAAWLLPNRMRDVAARNLMLCYPELTPAARRQLLRRALVETAKTATETPALWFGAERRLERVVREVEGADTLAQAVAAGRGVIVVAPHFGAWELIGLYCSARYPMTCMYRPPRQMQLNDTIVEGRTRFGMQLAPTDMGGVRTLIQALRQGDVIGVLPDQDPRSNGGVFAPFFGIPANTMTLLPKLARRTDATVLFTVAERLPKGRGFRLHFRPAPEGIADADAEIAATVLNQGVEACVHIAPAQYQWTYKRFKTRPAGTPKLY